MFRGRGRVTHYGKRDQRVTGMSPKGTCGNEPRPCRKQIATPSATAGAMQHAQRARRQYGLTSESTDSVKALSVQYAHAASYLVEFRNGPERAR